MQCQKNQMGVRPLSDVSNFMLSVNVFGSCFALLKMFYYIFKVLLGEGDGGFGCLGYMGGLHGEKRIKMFICIFVCRFYNIIKS